LHQVAGWRCHCLAKSAGGIVSDDKEPTSCNSLAVPVDLEDIEFSHAMRVAQFKTLAARAELKGLELKKLGTGYLLQRWGCVVHCCDIDSIEQHLQHLGA
jgi:hypothetical protein